MRQQIRDEVGLIVPLDDIERESQVDALNWIDSGIELCRRRKPDVPPKHLVSYFAVVDGEHVLLVDHINAQLWLPTGGHVEPDEHPRTAALREAKEELAIEGQFLHEGPMLLTITETVGKTAGHTDVSLWYVLRGDRSASLQFDQTEFNEVKWFHRSKVPLDRTDPHMGRFLTKLFG